MSGKLKLTSDKGAYTCTINPESIKYGRKITVEVKSAGHTAGKLTKHETYEPESLSFELVIDGTITPSEWSYSVQDVAADLKTLLTCVYDINSGTHESPIINVNYADIPAGKKWRCTSVDVNYTLFNSSGDALRAKVSLSLQEHITPEDLTYKSKLNSPDMTHIRTIRQGDNLLSICKEIYGKIDYYMLVADHNGLSNFRDLEIGQTLEFPPLER